MSHIITVLGGKGYIGSKCISLLLKHPNVRKIYSVSRSVKNNSGMNQFDDRVEFVSGDCLNPDSFKGKILESTGIIHSIGVLLSNDTDYQKINKQTCLRVAEIANEGKTNPKTNFVFVSAMRGLPFPLSLKYHGYIESKRECEKNLLQSMNNLNTIILRPGCKVK